MGSVQAKALGDLDHARGDRASPPKGKEPAGSQEPEGWALYGKGRVSKGGRGVCRGRKVELGFRDELF